MNGPSTLTTLADYRAYSIWVDCRACRRMVKLNLVELGMKYGWETPLADVRRRLRCECGSTEHTVTISHDGTPMAPGSDLPELP